MALTIQLNSLIVGSIQLIKSFLNVFYVVSTLGKCEILGVSLLSSINYFIVLNSMLLLDLQQQVI